MNIVLLGYGKMGKLCEEIAISRGHIISAIATSTTNRQLLNHAIANADILIDFSRPECVVDNILMAISLKKNIVIGTTGWYNQLPEISPKILTSGIGCLYSPNFSLGIALFNTLTSHAAKLFSPGLGYDAAVIDVHHNKKLDAPSGTGKTLASTIEKHRDGSTVPISSIRVGSIPGTHTILFDSPTETITLTHSAHNRQGFAGGAVDAAEWLQHKSGIFTFDDFFSTKIKELL